MFESDFIADYGKSIPASGSSVIVPDSSRMILALRQIGYSLEQALADLIDNSINAHARNVLIRFIWEDESITSVIIADDGEGMTRCELDDAMRFGSRRVEDITSLGKYGMGLKLASLSHARALTTITRKTRRASGRRWTIEGIENGWSCETLDTGSAKHHLKAPWGKLDLSGNGTLVIWDDIDKLPTNARGLRVTLRAIQRRLQLHLGLYFHRFLEDGKVRLFLDQQEAGSSQQPFSVEIKPLDPFGYSCSGSTDFPKTYTADIRGVGRLEMNAHIWPPNSDAAEYKLGNRAAARQGFYFYRNDRLIQAGGWNGLVQSDTEPHSSLARVAIDLPADYDALFGLNVQKSAVVAPPDFERAVIESTDSKGTDFESYRAAAQNVYRKIDGRAIRNRPYIPGSGVPRALRKRLLAAVDANDKDVNEVAFVWDRLTEDQLFDIDTKRSRIILNRKYRAKLAGKDSRSSNDVPVLKTLLFFLLQNEFKSKTITKNSKDRWSLINEILTSCLEEK